MFRIKTDIRQFKCEDESKVEGLIRNWIIRPTDLLYQADEQQWVAIGEHESFKSIFEELTQEALDDPDLTPVSEVYDDAQHHSSADALSPDESAEFNLEEISAPRQVLETSEVQDEPDNLPKAIKPLSGISLPSLKKLSEISEAKPVEKPKVELKQFHIFKKKSSDLPAPISTPAKSSKDKDDVQDTAQDVVKDVVKKVDAPLPVPQAPKGVEPPVVADEVTVMTERTAELLGFDDELLLDEDSDQEDQSAEHDATTTTEFSAFTRPEAPEGVEPVVPSEEKTGVYIRDDEDDERPVSTPAKSTGASGVEVNFTRDDDEDDEPRLRRGDLPEELFLTSEISSPFAAKSLLDELADDEGSLDQDSVWDDLAADDLRSTDEFKDIDPNVILSDGYKNTDDEVTQMTAMSDVVEADRKRDVSDDDSPLGLATPGELAEGVDPAKDSELSETSQTSEASDAIDEQDVSDPFTQFDISEASNVSEVSDASEVSESSEVSEVSESIYEEESFAAVEDFINRGYEMALPFPIGATEEDVPHGVIPSSLSTAQKDKAFPYPKPKAHMELVAHEYGETRDMSKYVIAILIVVIILIIATAIGMNK